MTHIEKMDLRSMDIAKDKIEHLKRVFPEVFTEKKVDFERLRQILGDEIETGRERYGLSWAGKSEVLKIIQKPGIGALKPCREESVNFDDTENLFIEGDNLEVLKLLQKSYYGKIKMIYIDPPYNTGNDFIYPDNYSESLQTYLEYTGQADSNGRKFTTNPETDGRFHTKWLNMMYPRLYLARNLLRDDGVIFVSIDDNEVKNLRFIMDEIFGEENFVAQFVWKTRQASGKQVAENNTSNEHEYVICYCKQNIIRFRGVERDMDSYKNPDNDPRGIWAKHPLDVGSTKEERPNCFYDLVDPCTGNTYKANPNRVWAFAPDSMKKLIKEGKILFDPEGQKRPYLKKFWNDLKSEFKPISTWLSQDSFVIGYNTEGTKTVNKIFDGNKYYDYPKPPSLIKTLLLQVCLCNDIILDFFSGSATTAHAVLDLNKEDGGNRKFIMVQLPEPVDEKSEAYKAGYKTIADIGKERIRRVIEKIKKENKEKLDFDENKQDLGFKVFKLDRSNFKLWESKILQDIENITEQLELHIDHINPESSPEDILYELLLKAGFPLTAKAEKIHAAGKTIYSVEEGSLIICLEDEITKELLKKIAEINPAQVICLDQGFREDDQLKTNAAQLFKTKEIEFKTV